jgi:galactose mutarotase-like enzyme
VRFPFLKRPAPALPAARDYPYVELRGGESSVLLVPSLGGKLAELCLAGRQWLWHSDLTPMRPGTDGASYVETADSGGWDECFPTVAPCRVPSWVKGVGGANLPDHGELWSQAPEVDIATSEYGQTAKCTWRGVRWPYRFERAVRVDREGTVHLSYVVANEGQDRLPFLWSAHPLFPMTEHTRLILQEGTRLRVFARHGIDLGEVRSEHQWPNVRAGSRACDFRNPFDVAKRYACKLFLDVREGSVRLREGDLELEMAWDAGDVPHLGLWLNKQGWSPFNHGPPYLNLAVEPAIGAPDTIDEALGDWKSAAWLEPMERRAWSLRLTGRRAEVF